MTADDHRINRRCELQRSHEHVDTFPGIKMAGVDRNRSSGGGWRRRARRPDSGAVRNDEYSVAGAKLGGEIVGERVRDRHVCVGLLPDTPLAPMQSVNFLT